MVLEEKSVGQPGHYNTSSGIHECSKSKSCANPVDISLDGSENFHLLVALNEK